MLAGDRTHCKTGTLQLVKKMKKQLAFPLPPSAHQSLAESPGRAISMQVPALSFQAYGLHGQKYVTQVACSNLRWQDRTNVACAQ